MKYLFFWILLTFYLIIERVIKFSIIIFFVIWNFKINNELYTYLKNIHLVMPIGSNLIFEFKGLKKYYQFKYEII